MPGPSLKRTPPFVALALAAASLGGCERHPYSDGGIALDDLPASRDASVGWESVPLPTPEECEADSGVMGEPWAPLKGRRFLEVEHGLGRTPALVVPYIAFHERGCGGTLASGDVVRFQGADDRHVVVQNATTEHFFLRLYLQ